MQISSLKPLFTATVLCLGPIAILTGCGGGSSGSGPYVNATATPVATLTPVETVTPVGTGTPVGTTTPAGTATPTTPSATPLPTVTTTPVGPVQVHTAAVDFGNGQTGTLTLRVASEVLTGDLKVEAPGRQAAHPGHNGPHPFNDPIVAGTYTITGSVSAPDSFYATGRLPEPQGEFAIVGTLATATTRGTYTLACKSQGATGNLFFAPNVG